MLRLVASHQYPRERQWVEQYATQATTGIEPVDLVAIDEAVIHIRQQNYNPRYSLSDTIKIVYSTNVKTS